MLEELFDTLEDYSSHLIKASWDALSSRLVLFGCSSRDTRVTGTPKGVVRVKRSFEPEAVFGRAPQGSRSCKRKGEAMASNLYTSDGLQPTPGKGRGRFERESSDHMSFFCQFAFFPKVHAFRPWFSIRAGWKCFWFGRSTMIMTACRSSCWESL